MTPAFSAVVPSAASNLACYISGMFTRPLPNTLALLGALRVR